MLSTIELTEDLVRELPTRARQYECYDRSHHLGGSFGVRVNPSGKKSFFLVYSINRKRKRITLGPYPVVKFAEAKSRAETIFRHVELGGDPAEDLRRYRTGARFGELCREFLSLPSGSVEDEPNGGSSRKRLKPTTSREYQRLVSTELLPLWGDRLVADISAVEVQRLVNHIAAGRGPKRKGAPVMANRVRSLLSRIFNFGVSRGALTLNPVQQVSTPAIEPRVGRILTFHELEQLLSSLEDESPEVDAVFRFLILTGQQPSAVTSLRWSELTFENWRVPHPPDPAVEIYLVPQLQQVLRHLKSLSPHNETVFGAKNDLPPAHLGKITKRLNSRLKFDYPFSPRDIRRTFQYRLRELGIRSDVIEKIQGRNSSQPKRLRPYNNYDYGKDIREALTVWADRIWPAPPPRKEGKIIQLFR